MASRSPAPGVGYDQSLLAAAPEVTKADKQEGYNPDLLEQGTPTRGPTSRRTPVSLPANGKHNGSDESSGHRKPALPVAAPATKSRPKKLIWIIGGVVLLVIIAVAVGVGVGVGSKKRNGNNENFGPNGTIPTAAATTDTGKPDDTAQTENPVQSPAVSSADGGSKPPEGNGSVSPTGVNDGSNGDPTSTGQGGVFTRFKPI